MVNKMYSEYSYEYEPEDDGPSTDIKIEKLDLARGQSFSLHYDYGDDWMFIIHVQKTEKGKTAGENRLIKSRAL